MRLRVVGLLGFACVSFFIAIPAPLAAQGGVHRRWEIPGFDFSRDGVWRVKARRVAATRRALLAQGRMAELNAPMLYGGMSPAATAITGTLDVPFVLFGYQGTAGSEMKDTSEYRQLLFDAVAPAGLPFSLNSFYRQMSNTLFGISGQVSRWVVLSQTEANYTGGSSTTCAGQNPFGSSNCNGLFSSTAIAQMQNGLREALTAVDGTINFALYDNDGPDGTPNSGDDDGFVDLVLFAHATRDGACGPGNNPNPHLWSHRFALVTGSGAFVTNDPSAEGGTIRIFDYLLQSGLGGAQGCDTTQVMPIGTAAHELGHGLGLPDLYDFTGTTFGPSNGIGQWGLMGTGNFASPRSPSRMESWSLNEMGWIVLDTLAASGTYSLGAAPVSDSAYIVRVQGTNPRGEYFLVENRQASQADTAVIRAHCQRSGQPVSCPGGLLIWHVDSAKIVQGLGSNSVNNGPIHGLQLEQADGFGNLDADEVSGNICTSGAIVNGCSDRGDAGDQYPGTSNNTVFNFRTDPAATKNANGDFIGFAIDQITQVGTPGDNGVMSFRLRFGALTVVRAASDTSFLIRFQGVSYPVYRDFLEDGQSYTIGIAQALDTTADGRTRLRFLSWSDGGDTTHTITGSVLGDTIRANLARDFKLVATATSGGTVTADTAVNLTAGEFIPEGRAVQLTASHPDDSTFNGWAGDTSTTNAVIVLPMGRPYSVTAVFGTFAITTPGTLPNGVMGASYSQALQVNGGSGTNSWAVTGGALPQGLTLGTATGVLSGFPRQTGDFSFQVTVTSGAQTAIQTFTLTLTAPALATADVVAHLLGPTAPLTADQVRYLDFLGNNNSIFDIGDFLAWVKATGAP